MNSRKHTDRVFVYHQHKIRGCISDFRSNSFTKGRTHHTPYSFRSAISALLLEARVSLRPNQFSDFLVWVEYQVNTQLPELAHAPVGYNDLSGVITSAPKASLELELRWITERIKVATRKINAFRSKAEDVELFVFKGDFESAIERLQVVESEFGASFWSIQLRIALEQQAGGLERQKLYSAEVRKIFRHGLLTFIVYYTSIRNEDKTTLGKYLENVKERIEKHRYYEPSVKTYLRYRLAFESPVSSAGFADILQVEQSHSLIDLFETFVSVIQEIVRCENLDRYRKDAVKCLLSLSDVQDYRLTKALLVMEGRGPEVSLDKRDTNLSDALLSGNVKFAALIARRFIRSAFRADPWHLIYAGFAFGHGSRERLSEYGRPQDIPQLIGRILCRYESSTEASVMLDKLAVNLSGLPAAVGIIDLLRQVKRSYPDDELRPWLIGLNSPSIGIEDFSPNAVSFCKDWFAPTENSTLTATVWCSFHKAALASAGNTHKNIDLFTAAGLVSEGQFQNALDLITSNGIDQGPEPVRTIAVSLMLHASFAEGDRQSVITLIADEGSRGKLHRQLLPVRSALESYQWDDYENLPDPLTASVALHLLWVENESSKTASLLRFAIRKVLNDPLIERPSKLYDYAKNYPEHQLIYFLRKVCVPNFMDHARAMKSSRMLIEERQAVCAALLILDPVNTDVYTQEISFINHQQIMDDGQWIVDHSRIHALPAMESEARAGSPR